MGRETIPSRGRARDTLRVASYLEEVGEDPATSCDNLLELGIPYIALKHVWTGNIGTLSDIAYQKLRKIISDREMTVILIASDLGDEPADRLDQISESKIDHIFNLASYFKAPMIRIGIGKQCAQDCTSAIDRWMDKISTKAISANVTPVYEITHDSAITAPSGVANQLAKHKRWRILYDPAQFILRQKQNPFIKYWTLLKSSVEAIDIRDIKIGKGFKPAGHGDSKIDYAVKDAINSGYKGWYIMEPSFGRRHGSALTKKDTFKMALNAFDVLVE